MRTFFPSIFPILNKILNKKKNYVYKKPTKLHFNLELRKLPMNYYTTASIFRTRHYNGAADMNLAEISF